MPGVHGRREAGPSPIGRDAGDVADPWPVAGTDVKGPVCQVGARVASLDRLGPATASRGSLGPEPRFSHRVRNPPLADAEPARRSPRLVPRWPRLPLCLPNPSSTNRPEASRPVWASGFPPLGNSQRPGFDAPRVSQASLTGPDSPPRPLGDRHPTHGLGSRRPGSFSGARSPARAPQSAFSSRRSRGLC